MSYTRRDLLGAGPGAVCTAVLPARFAAPADIAFTDDPYQLGTA